MVKFLLPRNWEPNLTTRLRGRPPRFARAMTGAERQQRHRDRLAGICSVDDIIAAGDVMSEDEYWSYPTVDELLASERRHRRSKRRRRPPTC
jgi:hypothetical protein